MVTGASASGENVMRATRFSALGLVALALAQAGPTLAAITADDDPILYWNETAVGLVGGSAPAQTRIYAMVNIAMHDAVNATSGFVNNPYLRNVANPGGDSRAAASKAARDVLVALNPANAAQYDAALTASLALVPDGVAKTNGLATGAAYATAVLAKRASDGSSASGSYTPNGDPGNWVPTSPTPAALPHWGYVDPFLMASGDQFRPGPPPALGSAEYTDAYNEVKALGSLGSALRTADQTASALFWDAANGSPWLRIGLLVAEDQNLDTLGFARSFALLTTSLADSLISGFDAKYEYDFWRPITAIQNGDLDGNAGTEGDATWASLFAAPNHPSYMSTHSALSGAGSGVLIALFGDDHEFEFSIGPDTRAFTSISQAAADGANSRLWGGIHFSFDNAAGMATGLAIAEHALAGNSFNTVPEPASWAMMILGFGLVGVCVRRRRALPVLSS